MVTEIIFIVFSIFAIIVGITWLIGSMILYSNWAVIAWLISSFIAAICICQIMFDNFEEENKGGQ